MLTAITHNHDFGIDTVLVPGTPVRIHARISGHGSDLRGKEGTRKRSAGGGGGGRGDKRKEEEEEKRGEEEKEPGRGREGDWREETKAKGAAKTRSITWDARFVAPHPSGDQPSAVKYSLSLIQPNVFPTLQLLDFPDRR